MSSSPNITFQRTLFPPSHPQGPATKGDDILAVKMAISRAGFWPWQEFDEIYSDRFAKGGGNSKIRSGVAGFQKAKGLTQDGVFGRETFAALKKTRVPVGKPHTGEWAFSPRACVIYRGYEDYTAAQKTVTEIFHWWDVLVLNEPKSHYSQDRPIAPLVKKQDPPKFPNWLDCSGTVIYTCWLAGAKSPDPYGYSGYGNTNSLNDNGFKISEKEISKYCTDYLVLSFYGPSVWNTKHVCAVKSPTRVYSMGNENAPDVRGSIHYWNNFLECRAYEVV